MLAAIEDIIVDTQVAPYLRIFAWLNAEAQRSHGGGR